MFALLLIPCGLGHQSAILLQEASAPARGDVLPFAKGQSVPIPGTYLPSRDRIDASLESGMNQERTRREPLQNSAHGTVTSYHLGDSGKPS